MLFPYDKRFFEKMIVWNDHDDLYSLYDAPAWLLFCHWKTNFFIWTSPKQVTEVMEQIKKKPPQV